MLLDLACPITVHDGNHPHVCPKKNAECHQPVSTCAMTVSTRYHVAKARAWCLQRVPTLEAETKVRPTLRSQAGSPAPSGPNHETSEPPDGARRGNKNVGKGSLANRQRVLSLDGAPVTGRPPSNGATLDKRLETLPSPLWQPLSRSRRGVLVRTLRPLASIPSEAAVNMSRKCSCRLLGLDSPPNFLGWW